MSLFRSPLAWLRRATAMRDWRARGFAAPSPDHVKRSVLLRLALPGATWVETGTYRGETTALLAGVARRVVSLEPEPTLHAAAVRRFVGTPNVEIVNATSEQAFEELLPTLEGAVCFWLDGHFSGGPTFKGPSDTPVLHELAVIATQLARWQQALVLVDDLRLFNGRVHSYGEYPPLLVLVEWAEAQGLAWHIEHDIFVARKG
jgi:hypothetical protein